MKKLLSLFVLLIAATCFYAEGNHRGEYLLIHGKSGWEKYWFLNNIDSITFEKPADMTSENSSLYAYDSTKEHLFIKTDKRYDYVTLSSIDSIVFSNRPSYLNLVMNYSFDMDDIDSLRQISTNRDCSDGYCPLGIHTSFPNHYTLLNLFGFDNYFYLVPSNKVWQDEYSNYLKYANYFHGNKSKYYYYVLNHIMFDNYIERCKNFYGKPFINDSVASNNILWSLQPGQMIENDSLISIGGIKYNADEANELLKGARNLNLRYQKAWITDTLRIKNMYEPFKIYDIASNPLYADKLTHTFKYMAATYNEIIDKTYNPMGDCGGYYDTQNNKAIIKWAGDGGRSRWTYIMPTDSAWAKAYRLNRKYQYVKYDSASIRSFLETSLFYCNDSTANKELNSIEEGQSLKTDSLLTYSGNKISGSAINATLKGAKNVNIGNFRAWITDTIAYNPWEKSATIKPEKIDNDISEKLSRIIRINGKDSLIYIADVDSSFRACAPISIDTLTETNRNPLISGNVLNNTYITVTPFNSASSPGIWIRIPKVLSTTYDIYCVTVPGSIKKDNINDTLPNKLRFTTTYTCLNGKDSTEVMTCDTTGSKTFYTSANKVDTLHLGSVTFPVVCSPRIGIQSRVLMIEWMTYSRTFAIDHIFLVPKEDANESKQE